MSSALAIAGTSAVLQNLLSAALGNADLGSVTVTALAPDLVSSSQNGAQSLQVNLFLHQVTPNAAWRNIGLPSLAADGNTRLRNQPLALDLHYLLTVYGLGNFDAEALLGVAVQFLHETPVLARSDIQSVLNSATPPQVGSKALNTTRLANQIEMLKITPATLGREEMAWLWTALKADYRPTFPFQVSVVLIQAQNPASVPLPVLQRSLTVQPNLLSSSPTITDVDPPNLQPAACLGEVVTVNGANLSGAASVLLSNSRLIFQQTLTTLSNANSAGTSFQFTLPNPPALNPAPSTPNATLPDLPAGIYQVTTQLKVGTDTISSNGLPFAIAPKINSSWAPGTLTSGSGVNVTVPCAPYVRVGQQAFLLIGSQEATADIFLNPTNTPSFTFANLQPTGQAVPVRLRVDGIDSPIIDMTQSPPAFSGPTIHVN